jgi:ferredoxin-like protein FixX
VTTKVRKSAKTIKREELFSQGIKECRLCDIPQPLSNFRSAKNKSGVTSYCIPCEDQYKLEWHLKRRAQIKEWIYNHLKSNPCVDCGDRDVLALDFDHVRGARKRYNIAHAFMLTGMTVKKLETEIAKCDVRCGKCHRIRTHMASKSWKYRMAKERGDA